LHESQRYAALITLLESSEDGTERFHLPVLNADDAATVARGMYREMEKLTDARDAATVRNGDVIACERGCNHCCYPPIVVHPPEVAAVVRWLNQPKNLAVKEAFLEAYPAWIEALGEDLDRLDELHVEGRVSEAETLYDSLRGRRAMCAFNRDGACTIYPVRPRVCRFFVALDTKERCDPDFDGGPILAGYAALDAFMERSNELVAEAGRRLTDDAKPEALCRAVSRAHDDPSMLPARPSAVAPTAKVSRNAPCPCGSGKKYKRCCGA
jgi:Fe-S-cluster containining protein